MTYPCLLRRDEIDWFKRISDGKTVLWMASTTGFLWHATANGALAICSSAIAIDRCRNPYPGVSDRSADAMTCERCAGLTVRIRMPSTRGELHDPD